MYMYIYYYISMCIIYIYIHTYIHTYIHNVSVYAYICNITYHIGYVIIGFDIAHILSP